MTDETKRIFNAPWFPFSRACDFHGLKRSNGSEIFSDASLRSEVNRLARLPELCDALAEATRRYCSICRNEPLKIENLVKNGCPKTHYKNRACVVSCVALDWLELLRKVRDGK